MSRGSVLRIYLEQVKGRIHIHMFSPQFKLRQPFQNGLRIRGVIKADRPALASPLLCLCSHITFQKVNNMNRSPNISFVSSLAHPLVCLATLWVG